MKVKNIYIVKTILSHQDNELALLFELEQGTYKIQYPNQYGEQVFENIDIKKAERLIDESK